MSESNPRLSHRERAGQAIEVTIRLGLVLLLLAWGFRIVLPFVHPISWGAILAVALLPVFDRACLPVRGNRKLVGGLFILASIVLVIVPTMMLVGNSIDGVNALAEGWQAGQIKVPPPPPQVEHWPLIGGRLYQTWSGASTNLEATLEKFTPQLVSLGGMLVGLITSSGAMLLSSAFSLIIAAILMIHADACARFARLLGKRLVGEVGDEYVHLATSTVRSVAMGVVGTALIQAAAAAVGLVLMGIPLAALWALLVLILAVIQLPPLLVLGPVAAWSFTAYGAVPATIFTVWCLLVSLSDSFLKPILMGRGSDIPMLVILVGALGGMMTAGIMGLFVGAVVLALIYRLFLAWLQHDVSQPAPG